MKISNLLKPSKYINKIVSIKEIIRKSQSVKELINRDFLSSALSNGWRIESNGTKTEVPLNISEYKIFGTAISLNNINWQKDYVSGFEYPVKQFNKIKISKWFDKGIDIKFPWEVSRFYFAIKLAQNYIISKDGKNYQNFKELVLDWIDKNPFCYGVNWVCTMEVAIRAINWIVTVNIFGEIFIKDAEFQKIFNKFLIKHAEYISAFPEIYKNGHTTNHTTADYTGLLFLSLTLKDHPKSMKWLKQAIEGLESCIRYQTYEDGVNFEASIPYHRLVLEMFAYSALIAKANDIELSNKYYELLFKMFEYSAAYMDHNGNAPQVGDNDSGRILILHVSEEHDHSYLLDLGEHIFDHDFKSQCKKRNPKINQWLPEIKKINIDELNVIPRKTDKSIAFKSGGAYFLKNENFSLLVSCFPIGKNGIGGHNHYDMGSFTLSYKGQPVVVDPGTYTYTRSRNERDKFRGLESHNNVFKEAGNNINLKSSKFFEISKYRECELLESDDNIITVKISDIKNSKRFIRNFEIINSETIKIIDECDGVFYSLIHLNPYVYIKSINDNEIIANNFKINHKNSYPFTTRFYRYSETFGVIKEGFSIIFKTNKINKIFITF